MYTAEAWLEARKNMDRRLDEAHAQCEKRVYALRDKQSAERKVWTLQRRANALKFAALRQQGALLLAPPKKRPPPPPPPPPGAAAGSASEPWTGRAAPKQLTPAQIAAQERAKIHAQVQNELKKRLALIRVD